MSGPAGRGSDQSGAAQYCANTSSREAEPDAGGFQTAG